MRYRVKGIYYNGRRGIRWEPVTEEKYDGLIDALISWDVNGIKQFQGTSFKVLSGGPWYWYTSEILQLSKKDKTYVLETANTIYELEELDGDELLSDD